jgi:hypothetical protein
MRWLALVLALACVGCDNRNCLRSHVETMLVPQTTIDLLTGKPVIGMMPQSIEVCDEYEK